MEAQATQRTWRLAGIDPRGFGSHTEIILGADIGAYMDWHMHWKCNTVQVPMCTVYHALSPRCNPTTTQPTPPSLPPGGVELGHVVEGQSAVPARGRCLGPGP